MALTGYPKEYHNPLVTFLMITNDKWEGEHGVNDIPTSAMVMKVHGDDNTEWVEFDLKFPNSENPNTTHTLRMNVGTSLSGPFSYIKRTDSGTESEAGGAGTGAVAMVAVYEVED
jgi:hypothetical protein